MGLTPFQSLIIIIIIIIIWGGGSIIDDNGIYIQKLSDDILSGAKFKVKVNFKIKYDSTTNIGRKSVIHFFV